MTAHGPAPAMEVETPLHRVAPELKLLALATFAVSVALVPPRQLWPYACDLALVGACAVAGRVSLGYLARRVAFEAPFVAFVVMLPIVAGGDRVDVLGLSLSRAGLWGAWDIAAKATLIVLAGGVLAATTAMPQVVDGLQRLRVPPILVTIAALAIRYLQVILDDLRAVQRARVARGDDPRWLWQARTVLRSLGSLAARTLQRGERVHGAMLARGWDGRMPALTPAPPVGIAAGLATAVVVAPAVAVCAAARGGVL